MPSNEPRTTKAERREAAREKARQLREEQQRRERRTRVLTIGGLVAAVAVLAVAVTVIIGNSGSDDLDSVAAPAGVTDNGGIPVSGGAAGATVADGAVRLDIYSDYMCPICGQFEQTNEQDLTTLANDPDVAVVYHPVSILDRASSGTQYSTRAANAAAVVADKDPENFVAFHEALYANQPEENSEGLTDEQIAQIAVGAGVPQSVADTFASHTFFDWVTAATDRASADGMTGTPTIHINGKDLRTDYGVNWTTQGALAAAVEAIKNGETPTPAATS